jgi:hypothetical protein
MSSTLRYFFGHESMIKFYPFIRFCANWPGRMWRLRIETIGGSPERSTPNCKPTTSRLVLGLKPSKTSNKFFRVFECRSRTLVAGTYTCRCPLSLSPRRWGNIPQPPAAAGQAGMTTELLKVLHYFVCSRLSGSSSKKNGKFARPATVADRR